jgi:hypothetical protein
MTRADTYDEIKPLVDLCKAGRLFDVQKWIDAGKPVNPPDVPTRGNRKKIPLEVSIDRGFHSLVQVLLNGGAEMKDYGYNALEHALDKRRLDIVKLLVEHGADIHSVNMTWVFDTWDPTIMEYFIGKGADVETGYPLAWAFIGRIRTALGIYKRYKNRYTTFQGQANMALRYHCKDGNLKWVSLMLWAGADPYSKGPCTPEEEPYPEEDMNALEWAALYDHPEVFNLKNIRLNPNHESTNDILESACHTNNFDLLKRLLEKGFDPNNQKNGGSSMIHTLLLGMSSWSCSVNSWSFDRKERDIDSSKSRDKMKMIHLLAKHGAKWRPNDRKQIGDVRRSLLKMTSDYTAEFVWIMSGFKAGSREDIQELMRTPSIRKLTSKHERRINELIRTL